jgi:hypothetical protein
MPSNFFIRRFTDFWFEYKTVVPKGFVRISKLAEIATAEFQSISLLVITIYGWN